MEGALVQNEAARENRKLSAKTSADATPEARYFTFKCRNLPKDSMLKAPNPILTVWDSRSKKMAGTTEWAPLCVNMDFKEVVVVQWIPERKQDLILKVYSVEQKALRETDLLGMVEVAMDALIENEGKETTFQLFHPDAKKDLRLKTNRSTCLIHTVTRASLADVIHSGFILCKKEPITTKKSGFLGVRRHVRALSQMSVLQDKGNDKDFRKQFCVVKSGTMFLQDRVKAYFHKECREQHDCSVDLHNARLMLLTDMSRDIQLESGDFRYILKAVELAQPKAARRSSIKGVSGRKKDKDKSSGSGSGSGSREHSPKSSGNGKFEKSISDPPSQSHTVSTSALEFSLGPSEDRRGSFAPGGNFAPGSSFAPGGSFTPTGTGSGSFGGGSFAVGGGSFAPLAPGMLSEYQRSQLQIWVQSIRIGMPNKVFGVPLALAAERSDKSLLVPACIRLACSWLNEHGREEEGLYRIPGSQAAVQEIIDQFDYGRTPSPPYTASNMASLVVQFFKQMPENPFTDYLAPGFEETTDVKSMAKLLSLLPAANYHTLWTLTTHLRYISLNYEVNEMTSSKLSMCVYSRMASTIQFLIDNNEACFDQEPPMPPASIDQQPNNTGTEIAFDDFSQSTYDLHSADPLKLRQPNSADSQISESSEDSSPGLQSALPVVVDTVDHSALYQSNDRTSVVSDGEPPGGGLAVTIEDYDEY